MMCQFLIGKVQRGVDLDFGIQWITQRCQFLIGKVQQAIIKEELKNDAGEFVSIPYR